MKEKEVKEEVRRSMRRMDKENALNAGSAAAPKESAKAVRTTERGVVVKKGAKKRAAAPTCAVTEKLSRAKRKSLAFHVEEYGEGHEIELITEGW